MVSDVQWRERTVQMWLNTFRVRNDRDHLCTGSTGSTLSRGAPATDVKRNVISKVLNWTTDSYTRSTEASPTEKQNTVVILKKWQTSLLCVCKKGLGKVKNRNTLVCLVMLLTVYKNLV